MALHRQTVRTGKAGRPGPDYRNTLACVGSALEKLGVVLHGMIRRMALQQADLHWLAFRRLPDAGLLAQGFRRTDPCAHSAKNILVEDGAGRAIKIAGRDLPDEFRNIDRGRTGCHAGRVIAEIASVGRDHCLMLIKRRIRVRKILFIGFAVQTALNHSVFKIPVDHACLPLRRR